MTCTTRLACVAAACILSLIAAVARAFMGTVLSRRGGRLAWSATGLAPMRSGVAVTTGRLA